MNKKSRKRTSKHRQLFFLIATILLLWNCQKEDFFADATETHATASKDYHIEKITSKELQSDPQIQPVLSKIRSKLKSHLDNNTADRSVVVGEGFVILDDEVARITIDSTITWTFKVATPMYEASDIENFMVKKQGDVFTYFLIKYQEHEENDQDAYTATLAQLDGDTLDTSDLNLFARDHLTTPGEDDPLGGGGDGIDCEGEISYEYEACYQPSGSRGGADGHAPTCQHGGGPHTNGCDLMCSGSELVMIIDFSHCFEYTGPGGDIGDPGNGNDPNNNQVGSGGGGSSGTNNNNTVTTLVDPRCPDGKVMDANGNCVCPADKVELFVSGTSICVCATGRVEDYRGVCVDQCETTLADLQNAFPNTNATRLQDIADYINEHGKDYGIDTDEKLQHFLAQAGHEATDPTNGIEFDTFEENLNYRWALLGTKNYWDEYFNPVSNPTLDPNKADPRNYKRSATSNFVDIQIFANWVYDDANRKLRNKLGNTQPGDGYKFRGRGIFQLTGRYNYQQFTSFYQSRYNSSKDFTVTPDLLMTDTEIAVISALWYFEKNVMNHTSINSNTSVKKVTKLINGDENKGLPHRKQIFNQAKNHITCK